MSKILLISHIFPPAIDGGSKVIYKLGQYFKSQKHQTLYISSNCSSTDDFVNPKSTPTNHSYQNFIKLPVYKNLRRPLKFINLFLPKKSKLSGLLKVFQKGPIFKIIPFIKTIFKIIKFHPDLIVAGPLPTTIVIYAKLLQKITTSKLLINASFHQNDLDFHQPPLIKSLQQSDYIWSLTQYETNYFIKHLHINPKKIILAGNGVDPSLLISPKNKKSKTSQFTILFIGSLSAHKRVDLLVKSFFHLVQEGVKGRLIIAGQKTFFYPQIKKIVSQLPIKTKKRIKFIFKFSTSKLTSLIDNCDLLVLPSVQESFGLVLIESWARKKPVIVSNIPPLKELIKQTQGGLIFQKDNQFDLQQQIQKLISHPNLCRQLGQNGFNYVKNNYTWNQVGQKIWQKISSS